MLVAMILISCKKEETSTPNNDLLGRWSLISYSKGFAGSETYNLNDIIWDFSSANTVSVTLNVTPNPVLQIPLDTPGVYDIILNGNQITLPNGISYNYELLSNGTKLIIEDNAAADGELIEFQKL